ncbi:MAG: FeoB-associated Cys-rich membrane protein [Evtepia sp.]
MLQFLANNGGTILVSVVLAVIVVAVARYMIRQKKQGNSSLRLRL